MSHTYHAASTRGHVNHGWLDTYHTFSFADYFDRERLNFGALRVLNDDTIAGGAGFGMHEHSNMEIITIQLSGTLEHRDSMGNIGTITPGEVQVMSAGSGVRHSEYNASATEPASLLQIWIETATPEAKPRYDQMSFFKNEKPATWNCLVGPEKNPHGLWIHQDAWVYSIRSAKGSVPAYHLQKPTHGVYFFVVEGLVRIDGQELGRRDGLGVEGVKTIEIEARTVVHLIALEVPMSV